MAGKVVFGVTMSLDGFMAPEATSAEDAFSAFYRAFARHGCDRMVTARCGHADLRS
jgi:hypothetical protein